MKKTLLQTSLAALLLSAPAGYLSGQNIVLNGGSADIFFLYESQNNGGTWHTVARKKTSTVGTGFTDPWTPFTGALGTQTAAQAGDNGDYIFDSLTVNLNTANTISVGGTDFFFTNANGHFANAGAPDLGMRIRLREDQNALGISSDTAFNQFDNFTFTLNTALSSWNGTALEDTTAHVSYFADDGFENPEALFNSASGDLTGTFNNIWTHQHRNWGFSEYGDYSIVLDLLGVGGAYGDSAHQATINFTVAIPEPGTYAAIFGFVALAGVIMVRRRRNKSA